MCPLVPPLQFYFSSQIVSTFMSQVSSSLVSPSSPMLTSCHILCICVYTSCISCIYKFILCVFVCVYMWLCVHVCVYVYLCVPGAVQESGLSLHHMCPQNQTLSPDSSEPCYSPHMPTYILHIRKHVILISLLNIMISSPIHFL